MFQIGKILLETFRRVPLRLCAAVAAGCVFACGLAIAEDSAIQGHWAFRRVQRPAVPVVAHAGLVDSPIDGFILERLEPTGLEPAPEADRRTLIRRASYDLTGLPPNPADVTEFLADDSADAYSRLVERLLASPHYGERWGRYWLDVARYADTPGDTGAPDPVNPFAFTYRDYVVRSMNEDKPFDRFLVEQIAADQLELVENAPELAALAFITVGRRFLNNVHDTIDDRIDVITRGTMALTVTCARCHDHKYDPITTRDYYGLYGVLASSREPEPLPVIGTPDPVALAEYQVQREKLEASRVNFIRKQEAEILEQYRKLTAEHLLASRKPAEPSAEEKAGTFPDTNVQRAGARRWRKALEKLDAASDPVFAPWFVFASLPETEFADRAGELAEKVAANGLAHPVNPLVAQAFAGEPPASIDEVARSYARLIEDVLGPLAQDAPAATAPSSPDPAREALRRVLLENDGPGTLSEKALRQLFPPMTQMQIQRMGSELNRLDSQHAGAPLRAMALADNSQPQNARVFIRGNPNNPGDEVPRQFLEVLAGENRQPFTRGSGRLELAQAIASRDNPLTARVIVNRVWQHHFGEGLVSTPDDFGLRSDAPSHPGLLDYLATRFMEEGWSLKNLHRQIMLSRVYRRASDDHLRSAEIDPENRLLSKMNRRRLDFEAMRDTLLAVGGNLDQTIGGRAVELAPQPRPELGGGFMAPIAEKPSTSRRAIYGFIDRQNLPGLLRVFDFADPDTSTGRRFTTTVPQQALLFFNNKFVMQQACRLAALADSPELDSTAKKIGFLYQQAYQREPTPAELDAAHRFLLAGQSAGVPPDENVAASPVPDDRRPLRPLERFAHVLLMSDELMFVD